MQGSLAKMAYFRGLTVEMMQKERDQILNATVEDIHALAPLIEAVLSDEQICVVAVSYTHLLLCSSVCRSSLVHS